MSDIGKELFLSLKMTAGSSNAKTVIAVGNPIKAVLRPVATKKEFLNKKDIKILTEWRNKFVSSFLSEFVATEEKTAEWLCEYTGNSERKILFMIDDINGNTFGYMGLDYIDWNKKYGEADAIVKGLESPPGIMKLSLQTMLIWAKEVLGLNVLAVRVRSDNISAINFYKKAGFSEICRVPLKRVKFSDMIKWIECPSMKEYSISLIYMQWMPSAINF